VALSVNSSTGFSLWLIPRRHVSKFMLPKKHRLKSVLPLPWRYQAHCPSSARAEWCPDFPPARSAFAFQASDRPAHPPVPLYRERPARWRIVRGACKRRIVLIVKQATLKNGPLSHLERHMLYLTESGETTAAHHRSCSCVGPTRSIIALFLGPRAVGLLGPFTHGLPRSHGCGFLHISRSLLGNAARTHHIKNYFTPINFSNSGSVRIVTPSSFALSYFDPGSVPTTT